MKTKYIAEWYESDSITEYGFEPDAIHRSEHESLDDAKRAAFKNASRGDAQGWAGVQTSHPDGVDLPEPFYVNEIWSGKWIGWRVAVGGRDQ